MDVSRQEALDLLHKWWDESRVIHCSLLTRDAKAKMPGRIDSLDGARVHLSQMRSPYPLGSANFIDFSITDSFFDYQDAAHTSQSIRDALVGYDSLLTIYGHDITVALAVLPPLDDFAKL